MRDINPAALAKILETEGTDPITLVQIFWDEQVSIIYGDRSFLPEIRGELLDVGEIENVINAAQGSNSGSVSIRLNDTDGSLKTIHDTMDIHKRPVYILQWFPEIALKDAFIVFDGVISSPIVWKEGERTLSFEVLSKIEDLEVGYSAEEGNFEYIPPNLVGKAWPMIFGSVLHVPAVRVNDIPTGTTGEDTGIDGTGQGQGSLGNIKDTEKQNLFNLEELERECFTLAAIALGNAADLDAETINSTGHGLTGGGTIDNETQLSGAFTRKSDNPIAQQLYDLGTAYEQKGNEYLQERMRPLNPGVFENPANKALEKNQIRIDGGAKFPQKTAVIITINGAKHEGYFEGDIFTIVERTHPYTDQSAVVGPTEVIDRAVATEYKTDLQAQTFFYAVAGSDVGVSMDHYPVYYIVGIPHVSVGTVYHRKHSKGNKLFAVSASYYSISFVTFGTLQVTILAMSRPLSSRNNDWDDEIWCNCTSPIGPNAVEIMEYLINNYTNQSIDTTSFDAVRVDVDPYKCGFALLERKNALTVLEEIAYQSRCAVWFKGGRFFLKYLPKQGVPTATFTEDDVESGTMEVYSTETEDVVTKWSITWRPKMDVEPPDKIVYRYHIKKYGLIEQDYDCYIYNNKNSVQKFALFWLIRKANTWKKIRFSTFMTKLAVEPFDSVLLNFTYPWVNDPGCVLPVVGVVEKASYDSDTQRIQMEIWLPIRLGEMCPYDFAYPSDVDTTFIFPIPNDPGTQTDVPGAGAKGQLYDQKDHTGPAGTPNTTPENSGAGGGTTPSDATDAGSDKFNPPTELNPSDLHNTGQPSNVTQVSQRTIKPIDVKALDIPDASFPGFVLQPDGVGVNNTYKVNVYLTGLINKPTVLTVRQLLIDTDDIIPEGTGVMVSRNCSRNEKGLVSNVEYTMQAPVWLKPQDPSTGFGTGPDLVPPADEGTVTFDEPNPPPQTDGGDQDLGTVNFE